MTKTGISDGPKSQLDKFKQAARELECDDDELNFKDKLAKIAAKIPEAGKTKNKP